ncbi:hypothetical protein BD414DRAFT_490393 [Trametes punicea]|nr:hypothetical protein BD414DRAFT_490393 [Trametes punicea]
MDEVMREIYGSDWVADTPAIGQAGALSDPACERDGRHVGLGWDDSTVARFGVQPVDASFAGADSTLRLVSPSTPRLDVL